MSQVRAHQGQCHCGAVRFTAQTDLSGLSDCNCSRCRRLGWVMQSVEEAAFTLHSGEDALVRYGFNTDKIDHLFCRHCGIEAFARGSDGAGKTLYMINVNCLEPPVPVDKNAIKHWDGAKF